jgi:RimJ/RimL family protein N-acetyltransferase
MSRAIELEPAAWKAPSPLPGPLESGRVRLRFWEGRDAAGMLAALEADRGSYLPWLPWALSDNRTLVQCVYNIERFRRSREAAGADDFVLGIFDRESDTPLGGTGLHRIVPAWHEAEIGYWMDPRRRGEGLCGEAIGALIGWAFKGQDAGGWGLRRVHIRCAAANRASARVAEKLGLVREATLRKERWVPGVGWDDTLVFSALAGEWKGG